MKHPIYSILLLTFCFSINLQAQDKHFAIGPEIQQYPTGFLFGIRGEWGIAENQSIDLRIGYNTFDHKDFGVHNEEVGDGYGFTFGYRHYFKTGFEKWFVGGRTDLWWNEVEWVDYGIAGIIEGTSKIVVIQPTAIGGYVFDIGEHLQITPTIAGGYEVNIKTEGEKTGEGAILLWGVQLSYKI